MAIRGENVGTAYIRIIADGNGLDRSIRDAFNEHDDIFDEEGRKASEKWRDAFVDEQKKKPNQTALRDAIAGPLSRGKWLEEDFFQSKNWKDFRSGLRKEFGDAGSRAGDNFEKMLHEGMNLEDFSKRIKNITPDLVRAQKELDTELARVDQKARDDEDRKVEAHWRDLADMAQKAADDELQIRLDHDRKLEAHWADLADAAKQAADDELKVRLDNDRILEAHWADLAQKAHDEADAEYKMRLDYDKKLELHWAQLRRKAAGDDEHDENDRLRRWIKNLDKMSEAVGKAFGKGSRNNFINILGGVAGGLTNLLTAGPVRALKGIIDYGNKIKEVFGEKGVGGVLSMLGKDGLKVFGVLAGAVGGLFFVVGPLVSLLSQLLGGLVALAGSVGMGAAGALGALAGAALPAAAGLGVLIIGLKNLHGEAQKSAKGIISAFKGLGKAAGEGLMFDRSEVDANHHHAIHSFAQVLDRIKGMVQQLDPVTRKVGHAVADAMDIFTEKVGRSGGAWDKFIHAITGNKDQLGWLGTQTRKVGRIIGEAFGGLLGLLRSLMPLTNDFLTWLRDTTVEFRKWVNSDEGQKKMLKFWKDAGDSAKAVGDFILSATKLLGTLISTGNEAGDGLFGSMTDAMDKWNEQLKADGGKGLRQWFSDSAQFARDLGDALVSIVKLFGTLDTEASRGMISAAFKGLANIIDILNGTLGTLLRAFNSVNDATHGFAGQMAAAAFVFPKFSGAISSVTGKMDTLSSGLKNAETRAATMKSALKGLAGIGGMMLLADSTRHAGSAMGTLEGAAGGAMTGFAVGGPWGAAIGGAAGALLPLISNTKDASAAQGDLKAAAQDVIDTLNRQSGALTAQSRALVVSKLQAGGWLGVANKMHLNLGELTNATMSGQTAIERFRAAYLQSLPQSQRAEFVDLTNQMFHLNDSLFNGQKAWALQQAAMGKSGQAAQALRNRIQHLSEKYNLVPAEIKTIVTEFGSTPTVKKVRELARQYHLMPKDVKSLVSILGDDTSKKKIKQVMAALKDVGNQHPTPRVDADTGPATKELNGLQLLTKNLFGIKIPAIAKVNGDNKDATDKANSTKLLLRNLVDNPYTAKVNADNSQALNAIDQVAYNMANLHDRTININTRYTATGRPPKTATGGLFNYAQTRLIGEAGPEAVVPLNRPLGQVDPAVRWLSAIAQGKGGAMANGGVVGGGRTVDVGGITVVSPNADPKAVAVQMMNQLVAAVI